MKLTNEEKAQRELYEFKKKNYKNSAVYLENAATVSELRNL